MGDYKGAGVLFVRKLLRERGAKAEARFLDGLEPEERELFMKTTASSWVPVETMTRYQDLAAALLYPGQSSGLRDLGRAMAADHLTGLYQALARLTTVPFLMSQTARLWSTYHRQGRASTRQGEGANHVIFTVEGYPTLPEHFRECLSGYVHGMLELVGARDIRVLRASGASPEAWTWTLFWK